jgi:hypothetical protein
LDQYLGAANVSNIDKQCVAAVRKLEQLGYTFAGDWHPPAGVTATTPHNLMSERGAFSPSASITKTLFPEFALPKGYRPRGSAAAA